MADRYYTTSTAFLEALAEAGVRCIFANLGSDHPGLIEALAQARAEGRSDQLPQLIVCPHETVALSAAHAYAAVCRTPQAVIVHVDSGTQNLGGAVNNAMRGRVPVLIFAGAAPYTIQGELPGSRNEFIHWIQDSRDQRGILRNYVKYDNEILTACVRELLAAEDALVLTEAITNFQVVAEHLRANRPGSLIGSGGGSLGWSGGGAVGAKLAAPERTVVSLVGDGTYLFGVPSSAQWVQRRYETPSLTVIYDNRGWKAPKQSTLGVHPAGAAAAADDFHVSFEPEADLPGVAVAAGGAFGATVNDPVQLPGVLKEALAAVHAGRSAVVSVHLPPAQGGGPVGLSGDTG